MEEARKRQLILADLHIRAIIRQRCNMPVVSTVKMTSRQFLALGEDPPGVRLELVDGEIAVSPSPDFIHSRAEKRLIRILLNHIIDHDLGDLCGDNDTVMTAFDVRRPDIIFYRKDREHLIPHRGALNAPPDLCVEIVSPSSGTIDRVDKFQQYADAGIAYYWILDPSEKTIEGYRLEHGQYVLTGSARENAVVSLQPFDDLKISLGDIWVPERRA
jgi:Uma2 family endonuclease